LKPFIQRWVVTTLAVLVAAHIVKGIDYDTLVGLAVASLLLGILNAFVRPVMVLLALPLLICSLGLFVLFINAFLLYVVGQLVPSFHVVGFGPAFWGGLVISIVSLAVNALTGAGDTSLRTQIHRVEQRPPRGPDPGSGSGPVIDV